jgi:hypothetical protein
VVTQLQGELREAMGLMGAPTLATLTRDLVADGA